MAYVKSLLNNNVNKLALLSFFSLLFFYTPLMTLFLQDKGLTLWQVNSLWSVILISSFLAEIPTGIIADKIGRKHAISIALFLQFVDETIFIFSQDYIVLLFISVFTGIGFAFNSGARGAFLYDDLKAQNREEEMAWAQGRILAGARMGNIVSLFVGGILASRLGLENFRLLIILTSAALAVALLLSFTLDDSNQPTRKLKEQPKREKSLFAAGWAQIWGTPILIGLAFIMIFSNSFSDYFINFYQPYFVMSDVPTVWLGWAPAAGAFVGIFTAIHAWRLRVIGEVPALMIALTLPALFYFGMAWRSTPVWAIAMMIGFVASLQLIGPLMSQKVNRYIASETRATTLSVINMGRAFYEAGMGFLLGAIAERSLSGAFWVMGGLILAAAGVAQIIFSRHKTIAKE